MISDYTDDSGEQLTLLDIHGTENMITKLNGENVAVIFHTEAPEILK